MCTSSSKQSRRAEVDLALRGAIIPHAGKQYAGAARRAAFELMKGLVTHIIYIATVH